MKLVSALLSATLLAVACETVPIDTSGPGATPAPSGVIQGTVVYQGPHPCSQGGHIVGDAILLFFDQNDPPPPAGVAGTAVNFGVVSGESLFANEPRSQGAALYCPQDHGDTSTLTASAPFAVSPFVAGTYIVEAFFDTTGDFLPTFKFRELPEKGDVAGGYIDTTAALTTDAGVNYQPTFLPITVGVPGSGANSGSLVLPSTGYDANNITVSIGEVLPLARPYFYPQLGTAPAAQPTTTPANPSGAVDYVPVVTMPQDLHVLAPPPIPAQATVQAFQDSFVKITLSAGVPASELAAATSPSGPFLFQLGADAAKSLFLWRSGQTIPENALIPSLYPQVVFTGLTRDPSHTLDPQSITSQTQPVVVSIGITLPETDSLYDAALMPQPGAPGPSSATDHVTALIRPTVVCLDPANPGAGATLVTPFLKGMSADPTVTGQVTLFNASDVVAALKPVFGNVTLVQGCLPPGRFAINLVYPTGQAWTVPNESGSCAISEGTIDFKTSPPSCSVAPQGAGGARRDVLFSQGPRGVVEILEVKGSPTCAATPVPAACLPK